LELAEAIASKDNPLTTRVIVNRIWAHHFGNGLVRTPSDFGLRSETPTHPELLDWLAHNFMENGWSMKKLHREILLSQEVRPAVRGSKDAARHGGQGPELLRQLPPRESGVVSLGVTLLFCRPERKRRTSSPLANGMRSFASLRMTENFKWTTRKSPHSLTASPKAGAAAR
jgi:hypothetical protein